MSLKQTTQIVNEQRSCHYQKPHEAQTLFMVVPHSLLNYYRTVAKGTNFYEPDIGPVDYLWYMAYIKFTPS